MKFAKWIFRIAGIYGVLLILPMYFSEAQFSQTYPPAITHVEYYYGFVGVTLAWQLAFLIMSSDPQRYRPLMLPAVAEKFVFAVPALILFLQGSLPLATFGFGMVDMLLGVLFIIAYLRTRAE